MKGKTQGRPDEGPPVVIQASPCPETPEPEPELDVKPPGHDDGHVPYLQEIIEYHLLFLEITSSYLFAITCQPH